MKEVRSCGVLPLKLLLGSRLCGVFAPGETAKILTVPIQDNAYYSSMPQRVNVICGGTGPGTSSSTSIISVTVTEDEPFPTIVVPESVEFTETDAAQSVIIPISFVPEFRYPEIYVRLNHGTATIKDVECQGYDDRIELTIFGDEVPENDETATVQIVGDASREILLTIVDDDRPPFPYTFRQEDYGFHEGEIATIVIERSGSLSDSAELTLFVRSGTRQLWYTLPVVFAPGMAVTEIELQSFEDAEFTGARTAILELELAGWVGARANITIDDNEAQPSLSLGDASVVEGNLDERKHLEIPVTLSGPLSTTISVNVSATHGSTSADDVVLKPQAVKILAGSLNGIATFDVIGDIALEENETFQVQMANCCDGLVTIGRRTATATIVNDDAAPTQTVYRLPFTQTEFPETGTWLSVPVHRFGRLDLRTLVTLRLTSSDARVFVPRKVWFEPNETAHEARFYIVDDLYSGDANVRVDLFDGSRILQSATVRILERNYEPTIVVLPGSAREGVDSAVPVKITVEPRSTQPISLDVHPLSSTALYGIDLPPFSQTITIPPLASSFSFEIPIYDDVEPEKDEEFDLHVSSLTGARLFAAFGGSILDDDSVYIVTNPYYAEVGSVVTITVHLPVPAPAEDAIQFDASPSFLEGPPSVVVPKGARSVSFTVTTRLRARVSFTITAPKFLNATRITSYFEIVEYPTLTLDPEALTLDPGTIGTVNLPILRLPYWPLIETSDPAIAAVSQRWDGQRYSFVVYAVSPGQAEIRVRNGSSSVRLPVVVTDAPGVTSRRRSVRP
jgi:hypothetical protein